MQIKLAENFVIKGIDPILAALRTEFPDIVRKAFDDAKDSIRGAVKAAGETAQTKANGGIIYASQGRMVNFEPKGTDTVPAMLTEGEFVINKRATQKNLGLLHAISIITSK